MVALAWVTRGGARALRLEHRIGSLTPGKKADLNVIDLERLTLHRPEMHHDLPANAPRLLQAADGYEATIVGGQVVRRDGVDTGARPGVLLRGAR